MFTISIDGETMDEVAYNLRQTAQAFGIALEPEPVSIDAIVAGSNLQEIIELFETRMRAEGYVVNIQAITEGEEKVVNLDKRARRAKPAASVITADADNKTDWEEVKSECISRIKALYFRPGGEAIVNNILKSHAAGAKTFNDVPAEKFGPVKDALDKVEGA
jgi:hypothetical protein